MEGVQEGVQVLEPKCKKPGEKKRCPVCGFVSSELGLRIHVGMMHKDIKRKLFANNLFLDNLELAEKAATEDYAAEIPRNILFYDWGNYLELLKKAYEAGTFVMILGSKGTGKTTLVRRFAELLGKPLYTINFSLRTKESHLVGSMLLENGSTKFALGVIPKSMEEGAILYLDELNAAEPDVLLRLDEALDDRRELVLKESHQLRRIVAKPDWFVIATINPLTHAGTKELPPQLVSRFPVRLIVDYPPPEVERKIVQLHLGLQDDLNGDLDKAILLANKLREAAKVGDLSYSPSIRETIAFAKLLKVGVRPKEAAEMVFAAVYFQYSEVEVQKVRDLIASLWGSENEK